MIQQLLTIVKRLNAWNEKFPNLEKKENTR